MSFDESYHAFYTHSNCKLSATYNVQNISLLGVNLKTGVIAWTQSCSFSPIHSATYDVQQVKLHGGQGNVSIQCVFAPGSQARGCYVEIGNSSIQMNVTRSGRPLSNSAEQTVTGLTPGSYEVLIFDLESDGSFSPTPSNVGHVNVSETAVFPTSVPPTETTGRPLYKQIGCLNCKEVTHVFALVS